MPRVLLTSCCPDWPLIRQTPQRLGLWEDFEFVIDQPGAECDAWVVFDSPAAPQKAVCHPENTLFISAEPPEIRNYGPSFLDQFRWVITCHQSRHRGLIEHQQAHPWHIGVDCENGFRANLDYDSLSAMTCPEKPYLMSAVISSKAITPAHRQRLDFVKRVKARLGDDFHILGRGHQTINDKWEAIGPYRFHLALENARLPNWMTEKVSDAFLGFAFPFYFGATNAADYLPAGSFEPIDIFRPEEAVDRICDGIERRLDEERREHVVEARQRFLNELNIFPMLVRLFRDRLVDGPKESLTIYPKSHHITLAVRRIGRQFRRAA